MTTTTFNRAALAAVAALAVVAAAPTSVRAGDSPLEQLQDSADTIDRLYDSMPDEGRIVVVIDHNGSETRSGRAVVDKLVLISDELRKMLSLSATYRSRQFRADANGLIRLVGKLGEKHEDNLRGNINVDRKRDSVRDAALDLERRVDNLISVISQFRGKTAHDRRQDNDDSEDGGPSRDHWREVWQGHLDRQIRELERLMGRIDQLEQRVDGAAADAAKRVRDYKGDEGVVDELERLDGLIDKAKERIKNARAKEPGYRRKFDDYANAAEKEKDAKKQRELIKKAAEYEGKLDAVEKIQNIGWDVIAELTPVADAQRELAESVNDRLDRLQDAAAAWESER